MNVHPGSGTVEVKEQDFREEVLSWPQPVLVEFWASWSRPCQVVRPILDELALALAGRAKVVRVNADDSLNLSLWYDIRSIPTLICFIRGEPRLRIVGTASKEAVLAKLQALAEESKAVGETESSPPDFEKE